jgi:hypothetical protein
MAKINGGIIGAINPTSFGKCTQTISTSSGTLTTQPGTRLVDTLVVAGGGGGGGNCQAGGGGGGGFRTSCSLSVCGATPYSITVGSGGTAGASPGAGGQGSSSIFSTITSAGGGGGDSLRTSR